MMKRHSLQFQKNTLPVSALLESSLLFITAGKDSYVNSNSTQTVIEKMRKKCPNGGVNIHNLHFEDAFHDVLDEQEGKARKHAFRSILSFLAESHMTSL